MNSLIPKRAFLEASRPDLPSWDEAPTSSVVLAVTPEAARSAGTQGRGVLSCRVPEGRRLRCEPLLETPEGSGFAGAAITLAPLFRIAEGNSEFIARYTNEPFLLPISFGSPTAFTPVNREHAGVGPLNFPTLHAPPEAFPESARAARITRGSATVLCTVREQPPLACAVENETPTEWGFADQVIEMMRAFPQPPPEFGLIPGDQLRATVEFRPR